MGIYVASEIIKKLVDLDIKIKGSRILLLGITFKENCPDIRNTKVIDIIRELQSFGVQVDVHDPWVDSDQVQSLYGLTNLKEVVFSEYQGIVHAVAHQVFLDTINFEQIYLGGTFIFDVKGTLPIAHISARL
jgi:UDP-N-acetyl-D-galactosamine dehydrogenase